MPCALNENEFNLLYGQYRKPNQKQIYGDTMRVARYELYFIAAIYISRTMRKGETLHGSEQFSFLCILFLLVFKITKHINLQIVQIAFPMYKIANIVLSGKSIFFFFYLETFS